MASRGVLSYVNLRRARENAAIWAVHFCWPTSIMQSADCGTDILLPFAGMPSQCQDITSIDFASFSCVTFLGISKL